MRHLPNLICLLRLALIWPVAATLAAGHYALSLSLFVLAAVSDGLDGYLAKRFNWTSVRISQETMPTKSLAQFFELSSY